MKKFTKLIVINLSLSSSASFWAQYVANVFGAYLLLYGKYVCFHAICISFIANQYMLCVQTSSCGWIVVTFTKTFNSFVSRTIAYRKGHARTHSSKQCANYMYCTDIVLNTHKGACNQCLLAIIVQTHTYKYCIVPYMYTLMTSHTTCTS